MAEEQGRIPLPTPPRSLSRTVAAGKDGGRKMVVKDGDSLVGTGKCTGGRCRMRGWVVS